MNTDKTNVRLYYEDFLKRALSAYESQDLDLYNTKSKLYPDGSYTTCYSKFHIFEYKKHIEQLRKQYYNLCLEVVDTPDGRIEWFTGDWSLLGADFFPDKNEHIELPEEVPRFDYKGLQRSLSRISTADLSDVPNDVVPLPEHQFYMFCRDILCICEDKHKYISIKKTYEQQKQKKIRPILLDDGYDYIVSRGYCFKIENDELLKLSEVDQLELKQDGSVIDKKKRNKMRAFKRAKDSVYDICACNEWSFFFTGTFNDAMVGENTPQNLCKKVQEWLKHQTQRNGLKYILVAEYTPKNHRIHFHGLINDTVPVTDSGLVKAPFKGCKGMSEVKALEHGYTLDQCKKIYYLDPWSSSFGFNSCIPLDGDRVSVARYICKYITKDCDKIFGRYFWSSRNIVRSPAVFLWENDYNSVEGESYGNGFMEFKYDASFRKK